MAGSSLQRRHKPSLFDVLSKSVERKVDRFICHLFLLTHFVLPIEVNLKILLCFFSTYIYDGDVERVTKKATGSSEGGMVHETVERSL